MLHQWHRGVISGYVFFWRQRGATQKSRMKSLHWNIYFARGEWNSKAKPSFIFDGTFCLGWGEWLSCLSSGYPLGLWEIVTHSPAHSPTLTEGGVTFSISLDLRKRLEPKTTFWTTYPWRWYHLTHIIVGLQNPMVGVCHPILDDIFLWRKRS